MTEFYSDGAMTLKDFQNWAGIRHTKTFDEIKRGRLKVLRVGGRTLVARADARAWLASYAARSNPQAA